MNDLIEIVTSEEAHYSYRIFGQVLSWVILTFAVIGMILYLGFPHGWALVNTIFDHYILKRNPEYVIRRNLVTKFDKLYYDKGPYDYLRDRVTELEQLNKRPIERWILKDMLNSMSEIVPKYTGKNNNKIRGKGTLRKGEAKAKLSTYR
jgi:hypothetical protein